MALILCPECSKEVSDKARSCPSCGCQIDTKTYCPKCGSGNVNYLSKPTAWQTFVWGKTVAKKLKSDYKCNDCRHKW